MREVSITDTLTGERRVVEPDADGVVGIYACGPTIYSRIHIGNARAFVVFTLLQRFLDTEGYETRLVFNVTDVNDKIYAAASKAGMDSATLAGEMLSRYIEDTDALGLGRPDAEPLATETIGGIVDLIGALIERGHAYESGGDVYFRVRSFAEYGALSNRGRRTWTRGRRRERRRSRRIPSTSRSGRRPKRAKTRRGSRRGAPGGPGWHIECSAMAERELGVPFAIHGGGSDLVFPHHENEIAQTAAGRGRPLARIWMHNGMVLAGPEAKMAKSEGNVFLLHNAVEAYGAEAVVDYLVSGHYRQPLAFSEDVLKQSAARTERFRDFFRSSRPIGGEEDPRVTAAREEFSVALARRLQHAEGDGIRCSASCWTPTRSRSPARMRRLGRCSRYWGWGRSRPRKRLRTPRPRGCSASAKPPGLRATSNAPTRSATSSPGGVSRSATPPTARASFAGSARVAKSEFVYGRRPVAEAERGRRGVRRVITAAEAGVDELTRLAGSPDHQGIVAEVDPYPYADPGSLLDREDALVVALDQIQDPRNLGAICRSAEAACAAGVVIPQRRAAAVTAAACKASAGAVEHLAVARVRKSRRLASASQDRGSLDLRRRGRRRRLIHPDGSHREGRSRRRQRGGGFAAPRCGLLRRPRLDPGERGDRFAERGRGGVGPAVRGRPAARTALSL